MRGLILVLTLAACLVFGWFVPSAITNDFAAQLIIALVGGSVIGFVGSAIAEALE